MRTARPACARCSLVTSSQAARQAIEQGRVEPPPPYEPATIPYAELPAPQADGPNALEWNFYRREVGRLLAEGQEGKFILIKGEDIIGIWDTQEEEYIYP